MQTHNLQRKTKNKKSYKVGRGGKHAKTAGRGTKGQNARAGRKKRPELRDFIKRFPKLRGRGKNSNLSIEEKAFPVSLSQISKQFAVGDTVTLKSLYEKGLISMDKGKFPKVKILSTKVGDKEAVKKVIISGIAISASAKKALESAGGSVA